MYHNVVQHIVVHRRAAATQLVPIARGSSTSGGSAPIMLEEFAALKA